MYDYIIVGAGWAGSILARKLAENNKKVMVVERRGHIAGNAYDYISDYGIRVQKYGPHVFHSNSEKAAQFVQQYCKPVNYRTRCEAVLDGISTPSPFNFKTIEQFCEKEKADRLKERIKHVYGDEPYTTIVEMLECKDELIREYAEFLYDKDYKLYTAKQWNLSPEEIDPSVLKRVPVVFSYRDTYFDDQYEFIPANGFEDIFKEMLNHPNICLHLEEDALANMEIDYENHVIKYEGTDIKVIYTGAIDELFEYRHGILPYRSLWFDFKTYEKENFQDAAIVAYPQVDGYTRITEYTKMPPQNGNGHTIAAYEFPVAYDRKSDKGKEPYYPVLTEESTHLYQRYKEMADLFPNLILCGRLAEFKYYNMDQVILRALDVYEELKEGV